MGGGGLQPKKYRKKNRKIPAPNFKFEVAFGFFRFFFSVFFRYFLVFFCFFWYFFGFFRSENCLITHFMPIKPCKCLIKPIITNKSHLTRTRLTIQNWPKWKNRKKPIKNQKKPKKPKKKTVPNLKFAVAFGFFWVTTSPHYTIIIIILINLKIAICVT